MSGKSPEYESPPPDEWWDDNYSFTVPTDDSSFQGWNGDSESSPSALLEGKDVERDSSSELLAQIQVEKERTANSHRKVLFWVVISIVPVSLLFVVLFMAVITLVQPLLGIDRVPAAVSIAFISGFCVQSFALIGILAQALFRPFGGRDKNKAEQEDL